jgi:AraC-like DNA-binding protein
MAVHRARLFARLVSDFEAAPVASLLQLAQRSRVHRHTAERAFHDATGAGFHVWRDDWRER